MEKLGYAWLIDYFKITGITPLAESHFLAGVPQKNKNGDRVLYPKSSAIEPSPVRHLEFALKHEPMNFQVISKALDHIDPTFLREALNESPNSEYLRRLCFIFEWLHGDGSLGDITPTQSRYIEMIPSDRYVTCDNPVKNKRFRVLENAIGNQDFFPMVSREASQHVIDTHSIAELIDQQRNLTNKSTFDRAVEYLYMSETKGSFSIEKETLSASRAEKFIRLLQSSVSGDAITESLLVSAQNQIAAHDFGKEASFRTKQNWLENSHGRLTVLPPSPSSIERLMRGFLEFVNCDKQYNPVIKAACASFGFVYLHPFMDGNGRIHRFLIHKILAGNIGGVVLPVSLAMLENEKEYLSVLNAFSKPVLSLWDYERYDLSEPPRITRDPGHTPYCFFNADHECLFISKMLSISAREYLPNEIDFLQKYDEAMRLLIDFELPQKDASLLVRLIAQNNGKLSAVKRKTFFYIPDDAIEKIESLVREAFEIEFCDYTIGSHP